MAALSSTRDQMPARTRSGPGSGGPGSASSGNGDRAFFATHFRGVARLPGVEYRRMRGLDREARLYYVRPEAAQLLTALALLIDSQMGRVFGNFYMRVNRPPFPMRLFTSEAEATVWLAGQLA